jgi:hypothetical protein
VTLRSVLTASGSEGQRQMAEIIPFNILKASLDAAEGEGPDPEFVRRDEYGRPVYCFMLEYEHDGQMYGLDFWAYSEDDAKAHVLSMVAHMSYVGQKMGELPA